MVTGASLTIKSVSAPIKGTDILQGLNNKTSDSTKATNDTAELGKDKDSKKTETQTPKTEAQKKSEQNAAIMAALGHSLPSDSKKLQDILKTDPGQFAGIDANPIAKPSTSSPDASTQANAAGATPGFGGPAGGWAGAGAHSGSGGYSGGGYSPGTGGVSEGPGHHPTSLAELNARADSIAAAGGARIERIYDHNKGLQEVIVHNASPEVQRELAQLAPLYRETTGRSPSEREVKQDGDHSDLIFKFGDKTQPDTLTASAHEDQETAKDKVKEEEKAAPQHEEAQQEKTEIA